MATTFTIRPFTKILRRHGFTKTFESRARGDGVVIFEREVPVLGRKLSVQLWRDRLYRVSHEKRTVHGWRTDTPPTTFKSPETMADAILTQILI